ncbi:formate/nitrite transporter family protein [Halostella sp. JP-L12]|uniref:formate/nitrite transporter family protein n=1 Tax=Halostella TaxID=1843185 RepID=UPI000EF7F54D|nr:MULTISPECIES: formate/nitrite transporter family protein [Halostella]NHN47536.1 formate/nitrite transporter family protein [Halostella sp. JP-L12]
MALSGKQTPYEDILEQEIETGLEELNRGALGLGLSALSAGLDIGFGPLLMAVMVTLAGGTFSVATTEILVANMYAVGFILVVLGRSELFTEHTTLAVLPVLGGQASVGQLGRLWAIVYSANVVGGAAFAVLMVTIMPSVGTVDPHAFEEIALTYTTQDVVTLLAGGVLAGWLMGLVSWLVSAAQESISRAFFVWLVTTAIGLAHLPHCIAGNVEIVAGLLASSEVALVDYVEFLVAASVGNAVGGTIFVALLKYGHVVGGGE